MNEQCINFQSRTYDNGETARFCEKDLAPEAPWRCPDPCPSFRPRLADVGWVHGSLVSPKIEEAPVEIDETAISMLADAESIVNAIAGDAVREAKANDQKKPGRWWNRRRG